MFENIFDFSSIKVGDSITKICMGEVHEAEVTRITSRMIECGVVIDTHRKMQFDRKTGISKNGIDCGYLANVPCSYDDNFRKGLLEEISRRNRLSARGC